MAATKTHSSLSLEDLFAEGEGPRRGGYVGRDLGVRSFYVAATRALEPGPIVNERNELGFTADGHEKVYVVLSGHAVFTVDGEEIDAPAGTVVHLPDPAVQRGAVAKEAGTTMIGLGGRPGEPYRPTPGEAIAAFYPLHEAKDYEGAAQVARDALASNPGNALALFNLACCEALLGQKDEAIEHVRAAVEAHGDLLENARTDTDLDPLRDDPRFQELVA